MTSKQDGFSAVELLITLFIGSVFLLAGYQLSTQVSKDGADATKTAKVSNIVYDRLRKIRFDTVSGLCNGGTAPTAPSNEQVAIPGLRGNATLATTYSCPFSGVGVVKVTITATYNDGISNRVLSHAIYSN